MAESALWFGPDSKPPRAEHLHLTLNILDDFPGFPEQVAERLIEVGAAVAADPFGVTLDEAAGSTRSIALRPRRRNVALHALSQRIGAALSDAGIAQRESYRFSPHLTLSYRSGQPFSRTIEPIGWRVDEFVLVHSLVGRTRHEVLGRWSLRGIDPDQYRLL